MSKKDARTLGLRLDANDTSRVAKFENETSIEGVSLARAALKAALDCYEENGEISVPLRFSIAPSKQQAPTVKPGQNAKPVDFSNITPLPKQHLAAEDEGSVEADQSQPKKVSYTSGKRKKA
ncbi:hypothetical protein GCM10023213_25180 [Prosthecobacter algae]|uniref:Uncharacterized protein n=1 Tax=Prosthecobacter algae TaxID=1144682 RepID=A0ABP9P976_9BACT